MREVRVSIDKNEYDKLMAMDRAERAKYIESLQSDAIRHGYGYYGYYGPYAIDDKYFYIINIGSSCD